MPEPLLQLVLGGAGTAIVALSSYIVTQWRSERAALIKDRDFWRDRSLAKDTNVDKLTDTLSDAIALVRESGRGATRGAGR